MPKPKTPSQRLDGWKQIADYLGVSVRTAQGWEESRGLPIRRQPDQDKSRVFLLVADLEQWERSKELQETAQSPNAGDNGTQSINASASLTPASQNSRRPSRRAWLQMTGLGSVATAAAGFGLAAPRLWRQFHQPPSAYRIDGATLVIFGKDGVELWRYTFPQTLDIAFYNTAEPRCLFSDVDGDGNMETLFAYAPRVSAPGGQSLLCFSGSGATMWQFIPGRSVTYHSSTSFAPPFWVFNIGVVPAAGTRRPRLVVNSIHDWSFPDQVALLDPASGRLESQYWHRGQFRCMAVADIFGKPLVLLGGVNDAPEYHQATLVALDTTGVAGSSADPDGRPYFDGMAAAKERCAIFFPNTQLTPAGWFAQVGDIRAEQERLTVAVFEPIDNEYIVYEFDHDFRLLTVAASDIWVKGYLQLQAEGKASRQPISAALAHIRDSVRVIRS